MLKPHIAIASLGGTISMTTEGSGGSGVLPSLDMEALLSAVPMLADAALLVPTTLATAPGASLGFSEVLRSLQWAEEAVANGAAGAVLVQGTDTIEETSYLLDLYWAHPEPIVVTGAMKVPQAPGADGPANLLAAVQAAGSVAARNQGVLIVMNGAIHAASRVRKVRSSGADAFASPPFGPLGFVEETRAIFGNRQGRWPSVGLPEKNYVPRVALLETSLGDSGEILDLVTEAGFDGAVLGGFGVGHVSRALAASVLKSARRFPVVLASRTGIGTTYNSTYAFPGSEVDLLGKGAIGAGWIEPRKARLLLTCLLAAGSTIGDIRTEFGRRGAQPGGLSAVV